MNRRLTSFLVFGGAGLVGMAVSRRLALDLHAERVVVASLTQAESEEAVAILRRELPAVTWVSAWGNLFVPTELSGLGRGEILAESARRGQMLDFVYGDFEAALRTNHLANLIREHRPDCVVDCVNTATGISYQDTFESTAILRDDLSRLSTEGAAPDLPTDLETGLLSQGVPQIIRHVRLVYSVTTEVGVAQYLKIGTTGTGGMGLNIPYTHSEDRPSQTLLAKNAVAFAQTGLLFLMARTPGAPIVKELKPAALIGYKAIEVRAIKGRDGRPVVIWHPQRVDSAQVHELASRLPVEGFEATGQHLEVSVVNTGENGMFAKGEFAAITALSQMEFVTPEEIAETVVKELLGGNTGKDVIAALDGSVMGPSYRAGLLRNVALKDLQGIETRHGTPSIALGELGPPELSKLLFEAWLIHKACGDRVLGAVENEDGTAVDPTDLARRLADGIGESTVGRQAVSIGIPILLPDGQTFLRGPLVKVPEIKGKRKIAAMDSASIDRWARRGWIDLRPLNIRLWQDRLRRIASARQELVERGSAAVGREAYLPVMFKIGDMVAWVFNNEMGGFRHK